jgi:enoyl-CoA hydratase/carnithine racemase
MILAVCWRSATRAAYDLRVTPPQATGTPPILSIDGAVARIELARPEQHNAIEAEDVRRIQEHLEGVDAEPEVRVLVLTANGPTFCAGASLGQIETGEMSGALFETLADRLADVRVPTICALNGGAFGGGTELALCCDFRIGVVGSRASVPAAALGLCYPPGGLRRFVEALGLGVASRLLLAGEELDADELVSVGFLHLLVRPEDLEAATTTLAARLAAGAPLAVQGMKRILRQVARGEVDAKEASRLVAACATSADLREGLAARRERRDPDFRGA